MTEQMRDRKRVRLRKGRIAIACFLLLVIVYGIIRLFASFLDSDPVKVPESVPSSEAVSSVPEKVEIAPICIDAGHGGIDAGSFYGERLEKDDNLRLALKVQDALEERGYPVYMIREEDEFVQLEDRPEMANAKECSVYVSLHRNMGEGNGVEIWIRNDSPAADLQLAEAVMAELEKTGISRNRGVRTGYQDAPNYDYHVNFYTDMPSCLIELGFINSEEDNALWDQHEDAYATAVAKGIVTALELPWED